MEREMYPQYVRIALSIASSIARGDFQETKKLPGMNALATEYNVSAETVRRALQILSDLGIVRIRENYGTVVHSEAKAREYLKAIDLRREQLELREKLSGLFAEYETIGREMEDVSRKLLESYINPLPSEESLPTFEVTVSAVSDKIGKSIYELRFWQETGVTVAAVRRGQYTEVSPGPYIRLRAEDVIVCVGAPDSLNDVERYINGSPQEKWRSPAKEETSLRITKEQLQITADALSVKPKEIRNITVMSKGMTNHSFQFTCRGKKYILRIPGEGTSSLINRYQEADVYNAVKGTGLCDDLLYINPDNGMKIAVFLDDVRNCDPYSERDLLQCMNLLRSFHEMNLKVDHSFDLYDKISYYEGLWGDEPSIRDDYAQTKADIESLRPFVEKYHAPYTLTHIDAVPDNFLFFKRNGKEGLQLTDWEYSGMQDPHVDIAMFCIYSMYRKEEIDHLIDLYFQGDCDPYTRTKIYCYIAICGLLWSNWCEYKYHLGVDYGEYARRQYLYAKDYYLIARKEIDAYDQKQESENS